MRRLATALAAALSIGAADAPRERVVTGDGIVAVSVDGTPARLRVDPSAPAMPLIDRALAERAKLKMTGSWGVGVGFGIGPVTVMSRTQVVRIDLGTGAERHRVGWTTRPFAAAAEGSVGPGALDEPIVRFQLRAPVPGERTVTFPATRTTAAFGLFGNFSATFAEIDLGGEPLRVRFDPYHARTLATAGAGVRLARLNGGTLSGDAVPTEIFFGVERPVRTLTLARPFTIGALAIARLGVRTSDYGTTAAIRDADAPAVKADPDEIVVTAKNRKRDTRRDTVSLGADVLARCSSIVFDRDRREIRLTCG